jgi:hypothetical protein
VRNPMGCILYPLLDPPPLAKRRISLPETRSF